MYCEFCGQKSRSMPRRGLTEEEQRTATLYTDELRDVWQQRWRTLYEERRQTTGSAWWLWYNGYLESDVWKAKRRLVLLRENGVCEACREEKATVVHHETYANVGQEPLFELRAVCDSCHEALHGDDIGFQEENT